MNNYYRFPHFPLKRVINFLPGDIIINTPGDVFLVDEEYELAKICKSVLFKPFTVVGCDEVQFNKLFKPLTEKEIKKFYEETDI